MSRLIRNGVALGYEETGRGDPPLILLHGVACHRGFWEPQLGRFAQAHRVVAVDLRGHGESDAPHQPYTMRAFAVKTRPHVTSSIWEESIGWDDAEAPRRCRVPLLYVDAGTPNADLARASELRSEMMIGKTVGSGHFSQLEVPDQVNAILARFVEIAVPAG